MNANFYDIESLQNVFTLANYNEDTHDLEIYYLCDNDVLTQVHDFNRYAAIRIFEKNQNFPEDGNVYFYDLKQSASVKHLAEVFGCSDANIVNNPNERNSYPPELRPVCDTDPEYDETKHPYFMGYNSYNYDTTMLALFLYESIRLTALKGTKQDYDEYIAPTAAQMRHHNNILFTEYKSCMPRYLLYVGYHDAANTSRYKQANYNSMPNKIRRNMIYSGRQIDVARLNEKQSKVGLKRLLGMLGYQILESDKLKEGQDTIETTDQLYDLIAYNVSDVINLSKLFHHKLYQGQFRLKKGLLQKYPELIYEQRTDAYKPKISQSSVRRDRLYIDSSSAQLATKALCPYNHLRDMETVSFNYPHPDIAKERGIPVVNVLEESKKFFYKLFPQPEVRAQFDVIYNYYKSIEGKNFNKSNNYQEDYDINNKQGYASVYDLKNLDRVNTCLPYFDKDGKPTSCFVTFSTGGIHGAEYNKALYDHDYEIWKRKFDFYQEARTIYPDAIDLRKAKKVLLSDGIEHSYSEFLKGSRTIAQSEYKDFVKSKPQLFKTDSKNNTKLNKRYVFTSAGKSTHEDFTSYYPNMLRMLKAFYNLGLGYDRYAEIFDNKQNYGFLMKPKNANLTQEQADFYQHLREETGLTIEQLYISDAERELYDILRNGTKLILNSASGAGDTNYETNIRMNNTIISMRIIGQLFSWRIGQAQTYAGASIISTNTDGLYSVMEDETKNNNILAKESADIGVEIEPEPLFLISKDTNNRIELNVKDNSIISASGGTLGCRRGPDPSKSLSHPAIIDWALAEYLILAAQKKDGLSLDGKFNKEVGMRILQSARTHFTDFEYLTMFQNVLASSPGTVTYNFGTLTENPNEPVILPHYNRVFFFKDTTPTTYGIGKPTVLMFQTAKARVITEAMKNTRKKENSREREINPIALHVLEANGVSDTDIPINKDIIIGKLSNIGNDWKLFIQNKDLHALTQAEFDYIIDNLDYSKYLYLIHGCFEKSWRNHLPGGEKDNITFEEDDTDTDDKTSSVA